MMGILECVWVIERSIFSGEMCEVEYLSRCVKRVWIKIDKTEREALVRKM